LLFSLMSKAEPLKNALDRECKLVVKELIDEALKEEEITAALAANHNLSANELRDSALTNSTEIIKAAASEEESLRAILRERDKSYDREHWDGPSWLARLFRALSYAFLSIDIIGSGIGAWILARDWTGTTGWAIALGIIVPIFLAAISITITATMAVDNASWLILLPGCLFILLSGYAIFIATGSELYGGATASIFIIGQSFVLSLNGSGIEAEERLQEHAGVKRYIPSPSAAAAYESWRIAIREAGVLSYLRQRINAASLLQYSVVLSVATAPGLRHLGDLKYHVPTAARDELIERVNGVDGGSFALAGPRGVGKTILMRAFCSGRYTAHPRRDLSVVVSAPVDYEARDFMLYLYAEVCKKTKAYVEQLAATDVTSTRSMRTIVIRIRSLLPLPKSASAPPPGTLAGLAYLAEEKLTHARYLQSFSTELSGKVGLFATEVAAKAATSLTEQPLTYPEIVSDFRAFLETIAGTLRHETAGSAEGSNEIESHPRVLIGIDELDRIGSGERARKFLDDIKAIFWVRGCYFLVSVSEDSLRAFELAGQGMRDVFDSAFDEVIHVRHLDFDASTQLLRARITGLSTPYHALAYCLSGGLPRELMRVARAITNQQLPTAEVRLSQVTRKLVIDELERHCHAARLTLANAEGSNTAGVLMRLLNAECRPTDDGLREFAGAVTAAIGDYSDTVRALGDTVAAHAYYLAALCTVFNDQLSQADIERACDRTQPAEVRFDTLASARRYLGVNDAFAHMLIESFCQARKCGKAVGQRRSGQIAIRWVRKLRKQSNGKMQIPTTTRSPE
jgi:hypothetical protein